MDLGFANATAVVVGGGRGMGLATASVAPTLRRMFPSIVTNADYCSSVNDANFDRVVGLIDDARTKGAHVEAVAPPGEHLPDRHTRKIAPTIVRDVDDSIATEETLGPVLTVRTYDRLADVIDYVNARPAPLVAYWFGSDDDDFRSFVQRTRAVESPVTTLPHR